MKEPIAIRSLSLTRFFTTVGVVFLVFLMVGCKEETAPPVESPPQKTAPVVKEDPKKKCEPGSTRECPCETGGQGIQSCIQRGQAYGTCVCLGVAPAPAKQPTPVTPTPRPTTNIITTLGEPTPEPELPPAAPDPTEEEIERVHRDLPHMAKQLDKTMARGKALAEFLRTRGGTHCERCGIFAKKLANVIDTTLGTCWALLDRKSVGFDGYTTERKSRLERLGGSYAALIPTLLPKDSEAFLKEWKGFLKEAKKTLDEIRKARIKRYGQLPEPDLPVCE